MARPEPLARYPVRTPTWVFVTLLGALGVSAWFAVQLGPPAIVLLRLGPDPLLILAMLAVVGLPIVGLVGARPYLVPRGDIELYADRMQIPTWWGEPLVLPYAGIETSQVQVQQTVTLAALPVAELDRGHFRTYRSGSARRKLSDRVFTHPNAGAWLLMDVEVARHGNPPRGPQVWADLFAQVEQLARKRAAANPRSEDAHYRALDALTRPED